MQTATATTPGLRRARAALSALAIAASLAMAGCSLIPDPTTLPGPAEETPTAPAGHLYEDAAAGFAITFPGEPTIEGISGSENGAQRATYSTTPDPYAPDGVYYIAGGTTAAEVDYSPEILEGNLIGMVHLMDPLYEATVETIELEGLPAVTADFIWSDGKDATIIMAGEAHTYYQLLVIGGTPKECQDFFETFELLS